ncbi:MAG: CAP domain-containing protein [Polyangiaceae bacterium]
MQEKAWWARSVVVLALLVGAPGVAMAGNGRAAVTATRGGTDAAEGEGAKKVEGPSTPLRWADETTSPRPAPGADPLYRHCGERDMGLVQAAGAIIRRRVAGLPPPSPHQLDTLLRAGGSPYLWPRAWALAGPHPAEVVAAKLDAWLAKKPARGERRCGIASGADQEGQPVVAVVVVDALADLSPLPARARISQWLSLDAALHLPSNDAKVVLLGPRGRPKRVLASLSDRHLRSRFMLDRRGPWQIQVVANLPSGPEPVLEAMVWVDEDPPDALTEEPLPGAEVAPRPSSLFRLLNEARKREGLPLLARDENLDELARGHAAAMMKARRAAHDLGEGSPSERARAAGLSRHRVGENVATAPTVERVHQALWFSPSHRENMLDASFRRAGVALAIDRSGQIWAVQVFSDG